MRHLERATLPLAVLLLSTACHKYVPVESRAVAPGEAVRVFVTREGSRELLEVTSDQQPVPSITGSVSGWDGSDLVLRVPVGRRREGFVSGALEQMIRVPEGEILSMERQEADALATGALVAGAVAGSAAIVLLIMKAWGKSPKGPGDDPVLLFSVPFG